ncbi:hypothetical protein HYT24_00890 [Candidatus Pacearchaeota archaeon]|nr:hypothetical protein [Candidatus Pacearchaeota archaeon]
MKINLKYYLKVFVLVLAIIIVFTVIDYIVHSLHESLAVPGYYFRNKIIFGTLIGFGTYLFIKNMKVMPRAIVFSAVVATLLQVRYFFEGYPLWFVFSFLALHFLMVFPAAWHAFKVSDKKKFLKN